MLYVYLGSDTARAKVVATTDKLRAKNPNALYFRITTDVLDAYNFDELTQSQGLFKSEYIIVLDSLLSDTAGEERVLAYVEQLAASPHAVFILNDAVKAPIKKKLEKYATKLQEFIAKEKATTESFNTFALTDAFAARDVKRLWMLFREVKRHGVSDEEIHGILFWMLKSLVLAASTKTAEEAGMKPYPFTKAKSALKYFESLDELHTLLRAFALLPQRTRRTGASLEIALEQFILAL